MLSLVAHDELIVTTHAIVTAGVPASMKTRLLTDAAVSYHDSMTVLEWRNLPEGADERAFRQISEQKLAALIVGLDQYDTQTLIPDSRDVFEAARPALLVALRRAIGAPPLPHDVTQAAAKA